MRSALALVACGLFVLVGCSADFSNGFNQTDTSQSAAKLTGLVRGGQQPVSGAMIQLYGAGTSGDGSGALPLLSSPVATDTNGNFSLTGLYSCPSPSSLTYLVASGGNPGLAAGTNNQALELMAALGPCGDLSSSTYIVIDEVTTVASIWALAPYMLSATQVGSGGSDAGSLAGAFQQVNQLVNISTGTAPGPAGVGDNLTTQTLNTLADILANCVNSAGGVAGDGSSCGNLFGNTQPPLGAAPTNTVGAALMIAQNPSLNTSTLMGLVPPTAPFQPTLSSTPSAWTIATSAVTSAPSISPATGSYSSGQTVTITDDMPSAAIYFTTDGSLPTQGSIAYVGPFSVSGTTTVRAFAIAPGYAVSAITTANYNFSTTPLISDTSTQYTFGTGYYPCSGTCDLSPSYNSYSVPSVFSITRITFNWSTSGGNNCNGVGRYAAIISSTSNSSGVLATSTNSIYLGCAGFGTGFSGTGELDFVGQPIPPNFYLDFATVDGALQAGDGITVSNVQIWGSPLATSGGAQIGLPILFVHGICDTPGSFVPAETAVKTYLQHQLPALYPDMTTIAPPPGLSALANEYVTFFDGANVQFQVFGGNVSTPVDSRTRFFMVDFNDGNQADNTYQLIDNKTSNVMSVPIYKKGYELASIIWKIKASTGAPRVIVVAHSMGGLDTRSYIEQLANPYALASGSASAYNTPYLNDIASLITLDTPHAGSQAAALAAGWLGANDTCSIDPSVDKAEMIPNGILSWIDQITGITNNVPSIIPEINYSSGSASPLPPALSITSIVSTWTVPTVSLFPYNGPGNDNVVLGTEQDLTSISGIASHSQSTLTAQSNQFGAGELLVNFCGTGNPLHSLLSCTGDSTQTFNIIDNAVAPAAVMYPGQVQITLSATTVASGGQLTFSSTNVPAPVWSIREGVAGGTIDPAHLMYTAPANTGATNLTFHIVAINTANPSQYGEASVTVLPSSSSPANPAPAITQLIPASLGLGSTPQNLSITGTGFLASSSVTLNGAARAVTASSSGELTISLTAADLAIIGSFPVVVTNPGPGGGSSGTKYFAVTNSQTEHEWIWMNGSNQAGGAPAYGSLGVASSTNVPGARSSGVSWTDSGGNLWLFGGYGVDYSGNYYGNLNDLWEFNPSIGFWTWMSGTNAANGPGVYGVQGVASTANLPHARSSAVSWADASGNLWLFGGTNGFALGNDLWAFSPTNKTWTWVSGSSSTQSQPGVYGTMGTPNTANVPGSRGAAVSWTDGSGNFWLFGGIGFDSTGSSGYMNDLWEFNPTNKTWTWVSGGSTLQLFADGLRGQPGIYGTQGTASAANVPCGREFSNSWVDANGNFWLFGGYGQVAPTSGAGVLNDLWEFNPTSNQWTWVSGGNSLAQPGVYGTLGVGSTANVPGARQMAVSWTDANGNLWLFGGFGYDSIGYYQSLNDLWEFSPTSKTWTWMSGSNRTNGTGTWGTLGVPSTANVPGSRDQGVTWVDNGGNLWFFGGYGSDSVGGGGYLNDLWRYQP